MILWHKRIKRFLIISFFTLAISQVALANSNPEGIQIYQKNMHLSEEHKQKLADDIDRYHNGENLWELLREEFVLPHYEDSPQVQEQIEWFMSHQDYLLRTATRAAPYLYFILQQVHKRHLPAEIVLLPMMESAYNPFAYSSVGAAGIWQIMPKTASGFGIKQDWWFDGRRDVIASTRAALDYLSYLGSFFENNWLLALAAYDTGEGNVLSAIRRNIREGKNTDYWSLPVARETQIYVPRLLALATIIGNPERYPIPFPAVSNAPYLAQIDIGGQIDLKHAAYLAGMSLVNLKQLNPGHNRSATDPHGPFKLILPIENVQQFTENLSRSPLYQNINWERYTTKAGDNWKALAKRFSVSIAALRKANPDLGNTLVAGKSLILPRANVAIAKTILESKRSFFNAAEKPVTLKAKKPTLSLPPMNALENFHGVYSLQPGDTLYMIRNGDDLTKIANRFHMNPQTLITANQLNKTAKLRVGDKLIIPTHFAKAKTQQHYQLTPGDTIYMVRKGDNIQSIATKFHTTPAAIRVTNLLTSNTLQVGDQLVIPTHLR